jgi:hypothetical protein
MDASRLKRLLEFNEEYTDLANEENPDGIQFVFTPTFQRKYRIYFLWIDEDRTLGGSFCQDGLVKSQPWSFVRYLTPNFLSALFELLTPEQVAEVTAALLRKAG